LSLALGARAQVAPEESARKLKPADGLEAALWAAEPMIVNPTTIDIDSRGRVWVTEGLNYRLTRGGNGRFQRIPEADRIKILEDTDGDGRADKMTVFADRIFPVPMGIAVEERYGADGKYLGARVYVGNSPDLLVLEDTDGDDRADKRYPLLTGFGGIDSDHGVHGMVLGPDGKLYFTHGDGCCSVQQDHSERTQNFDVVDRGGRHVSSSELANTLRCNRDGTEFEVIADRQRNNYETCLNSFGNQFTSDNDDDGNRGSRVIWVMDGGKYGYRTPGSPRHWGEEVPGMVPKLVGTGNGSPCGVMVYEGKLLPPEYSGGVLEAEAGPRQINFFPLVRKGGAFRTEYKVMLSSDDPWFRPVDVTAAPDGSVYIADWYDAGVGGHAFSDQTTGRIYRVAPAGSKSKAVKVDYATIDGLIAALASPVVATRDTARRLLIARGPEAMPALDRVFGGDQPILRARALWVRHAIGGDAMAEVALRDRDPRIREQAVRILGRDCRQNGQVRYTGAAQELPAPGGKHLDVLAPLANDPDAGVRRELILALRALPTDQVAQPLRSLARSWDGRDRWYLEALGLALRQADSGFVAALFDGQLYGDLGLPAAGGASGLALPPYFPTDRNEAYLSAHDPDLPVSPLAKTLGLAWMVHRVEVLPLLIRLLPQLSAPELQQAADDVIAQLRDPAGAVALARLILDVRDPVRKRQFLLTMGRKLDGDWRPAQGDPLVVKAIAAALANPSTRAEAIQTAAATGDGRYARPLLDFARDQAAPGEVRAAAVDALGRIKPPEAQATIDALIEAATSRRRSDAAAEAAVRALPRLTDARERLGHMVKTVDVPLGLRREALRGLIQQGGGPQRVLAMARDGSLPADLKTEATTVLGVHPDQGVREEAAHVLPRPKAAGGRPLPSFHDLVRSDGDPGKGRAVFFRAGENACGGCHRVQGRGQWVGPDLSTIASKYGKGELLRSILNPSASIPYSFHSLVIAAKDGRVLTGLAVEDAGDRLVLKTADGQRVVLRASEIEDRKESEVSLMPEGLAETMGENDLVDLLAFLATLKQPVSIVGQIQAAGPFDESGGQPALDPKKRIDPVAPVGGPDRTTTPWRRVTATAEGRIDLVPLVGGEARKVVYIFTPIVSAVAQRATLVLDSKSAVDAWLGGEKLSLPAPGEDGTRSVQVHLPLGTTDMVLRLPGGSEAAVVITFVATQPLEFSPIEASR
jgi:putative membrane-bound dehydrogenase-like protein